MWEKMKLNRHFVLCFYCQFEASSASSCRHLMYNHLSLKLVVATLMRDHLSLKLVAATLMRDHLSLKLVVATLMPGRKF